MKTVLKYPGAKWCIADWIIHFFPQHHSYLEPFFGSGGVFFRKGRSNIETVNDLDGDIVNLFDCIRKDPEKLAYYVCCIPYSREIYYRAYTQDSPNDPFERTTRLLIWCNMGHGFRTTGERVGWKRDVAGRERAYAAKAWCDLPDIIIDTANRLKNVQIECTPAVNLIPGFNSPDVLIYCDPPYLLSTRHGKQYRCEMTEDDHLQLIDTLKKHKGPALISGYPSDLYDFELKEWHRETTTTTDLLSQVKQEVLWMNFEPSEQMTLFNEEGGIADV